MSTAAENVAANDGLAIDRRRWIRQSLQTQVLILLATLAWTPLASAMGGVMVFGDSLSAAYGVPAGRSWVDLLAARLEQKGHALPVVNASISGETTQGGVTRIDDALARHQPGLVVLELGGNDALRGLPLKRTKENLAQMIMRVRERGARVLLLGMQIPPNYGPQYTQRFQALYEELHRELQVDWVPFFLEGIALDPALMQDDGIHPTTAAQPLLLDNVWPALQSLLEGGALRG